MTDLWTLSASQTANMIRLKQASATEVAQAALARLDAVNPALNAVVDHRPEEVLAEAAAVDARLAAGHAPRLLEGVPVTIKVNVDQAGFATTNGLRRNRDLIATEDNPVVEKLRAAGAVILGRTNTPAFSAGLFTDNGLYGPTINPRDPGLTPGGSSGGAAAATAAGIGCIAHGNDIGGSIRYPAYACGIHGLRPGLGRVATYNDSGPDRAIGAQIMSVQGPLARRVHDLRLALQVMEGADPRDPWAFAPPPPGPNPRLAAFCVSPDGIEVAPEVEAALRDAAERLRDAGWTVVELDSLPPLREASQLMFRFRVADAPDRLIAAAEAEGFDRITNWLKGLRRWSGELTLEEFGDTLTRRANIVRDWLRFLQSYPVLLIPTSSQLPMPADADTSRGLDWVISNNFFQSALPVLGLPTLAVATGLSGRAPTGIQIVAGRMREDLCLDAGEAIEARGTPPMPIDPITP
ncbi:amidase family protein [Pseudooceanicola sp. 502str34]